MRTIEWTEARLPIAARPASLPREAWWGAGLVVALACAAGAFPLGASIVAVFLCAGPHNWIEARYFLARLPGRWGRLWPFFTLALAGVVALTAAFACIPWLAMANAWQAESYLVVQATWNTGLVLWLACLMEMRRRVNPRRDWPWLWPAAFLVMAAGWIAPVAWGLMLVYVHPLVALWILDRELQRTRPELRRVYHRMLPLVPLALVMLLWRWASDASAASDDGLSRRIAQHAGADLVTWLSSRSLVACHVFLEMLHYAVWLLAIPLLSRSMWPVRATPLGRRSRGWRVGIAAFLAMGLMLVVLLWIGFAVDYAWMRDVYFTLALAHVLAEAPFLLRAL